MLPYRPEKYASLYHAELGRPGLLSWDTVSRRYRRRDWLAFHVFCNSSELRDVVLIYRQQDPKLLTGSRSTYYANFASPLKADVVLGVHDIKQVRQQVHTSGEPPGAGPVDAAPRMK